MNALEDRLRDSLRQRAAEVSARPELWDRVEAATAGRARRRMTLTVAGTVVAVVATAILVPGLLDRDPPRPDVLIDSQPGIPSSDQPSSDQPGPVGTFDPPATRVVHVSGNVISIREVANPDGGNRLDHVTEGPADDLAVRPRTDDGSNWDIAYTTRTDDAWQLRMLSIGDGIVAGQEAGGGSDRLIDTFPLLDGVLAPGLAWSPDGIEVAWVVTESEPGQGLVSRLRIIGWQDGIQLNGQFATSDVLADGVTAGRMTLADWTWDATYEDGIAGRAFFVGDGRAWQASLTRDASGSYDFGPAEQIDVADDIDQAGPVAGPLAVHLDPVPVLPGSTFVVTAADGTAVASYRDGTDVRPEFAHLAAAGRDLVVSLGDRLVFVRDGDVAVVTQGQPFGAVDLVTEPWIPPYTPADGPPAPSVQPDVGDVGAPPEFVVTTDGQAIDLRWSDGRIIQTLLAVDVEGVGRVLGLDVRPGSSTEDLTVAYTTVSPDGTVTAWSLRGRADDQAGLAVVNRAWPSAYQPTPDAIGFVDGEVSVPMFSGDGTFVALTENGASESAIRFFGWLPDADVPGTGRTSDDNTGFSLGKAPASLDHFSGLGPARSGGEGYVTVTTSPDGMTSSCEYERQADGALAQIICEGDFGADADVVAATSTVLLLARGGELVLRDEARSWSFDDEFQWPLPPELVRADRARVWMTGGSDHVFAGDGERAWLVTPEGHQELPAGIAWVADVR